MNNHKEYEHPQNTEGLFVFEDNPLLRAGLKMSHLRMLVMIEEHGQVSAAAAAMNMTQPAASRMLSEMEAIAKSPLCRRASRGVVLTKFGEALAKRARTILLELREASRELNQMKSGSGGSVYIGAVTAPAISLVVPAIRRAMDTYPGIEINVQVESSNILARELLAARHDFIIGRIPDDLDPSLFSIYEIGIERACLIVREGHPLLSRKPVALKDLSAYDWVFQPPGALLRRTMEDVFLAHGVAMPRNIINTPSVVLTLALVCNTNAIAPIALDMAEFVAAQQAQIGKTRVLPTEFDLNVKPYSIITTKGRVLPPSARLLYDLVLEESRKLATEVQFPSTSPAQSFVA
ncbi:LysR family transcriptional regulator [Rhizobium sp. RM]|uniref:LysR family transcriptional regulator n=1 Tax=Rhizobium sp. RM TaxID=2748079 RepID=UPI00110D97DF|nr:LysR family transcriptional regulator [Rhizobium sp. RM]NWJ26893.1 LysR family transcriptional regulator [Rhizobium sp. RM]TMV22761.1 LysR family transcriptional regulator [Rhizobium sp. Td3]